MLVKYPHVFLVFASSLFLLMSCTASEMSQVELVEYIGDADHGITKMDSAGSIVYKVTYHPTDLLVAQELEGQVINNRMIDSLRTKFKQYDYYLLSVSANNKELLGQLTRQDYFYLVQEMSFHMPDYVQLVTEANDTLSLEDFYTPRLYGMGTATQVLLAFSKKKSEYEGNQTILLKGLNGGQFTFSFSGKDIQSIPKLNFNFIEEDLKSTL